MATSAMPPERFPKRLADLGFEAHCDASGVEYITPPLSTVSAGPFLMGSDPKRDVYAWHGDKPQLVTLPAFRIALYPVTVAEYACFVRTDWGPPDYWWNDQLTKLDHPVAHVGGGDAVAYAAWLAMQTGQPWRLPNEAEWEKAARGTDGRVFPWGDTFDASRCNTSEGGRGTTSPVGVYSDQGDASPYGVHDLIGNVWEWACHLGSPYPPIPVGRASRSGRVTEDNWSADLVLCGGAYNFHARTARPANHIRGGQYDKIAPGFRLLREPLGAF